MKWRTLGLTAALVSAVTAVGAHQPTTSEDFEFDVPKPQISYAFVGSFEEGDEVFTVRMTHEEPFALPFELLTEHKAKFEDFRPAYAVVGPGLPAPTDADREFLPREVPDGVGVFVERNDGEREALFETVMRRAYYSSGPIALALVEGDYEVWIWSPDGEVGDFTLGFGVEEDFSDGGWGGLIRDWSDYAY